MFSIRSGWLHYEPFNTYLLPEIVRDGSAHLRRNDEEEGRIVPRYRLKWPGEIHRPWDVPFPEELVNSWGGDLASELDPDHPDRSRLYFYMLMGEGYDLSGYRLPEEPPVSVAYHLAVNGAWTPKKKDQVGKVCVPYPVAGLPSSTLLNILFEGFVIDPEYMAALLYLKAQAESHHRHPIFQPFDTAIREQLMGFGVEAARLYFMLLGDCLYSPMDQWYRRRGKQAWAKLACYLHWVGRTGTGCYAWNAGVKEEDLERFEHAMGDEITVRMREWSRTPDDDDVGAMWEMRKNSHITGKDPAVVEKGEEVVGPSLGDDSTHE